MPCLTVENVQRIQMNATSRTTHTIPKFELRKIRVVPRDFILSHNNLMRLRFPLEKLLGSQFSSSNTWQIIIVLKL